MTFKNSSGNPDSQTTTIKNQNQSDNFETFNKFAKITTVSGGDHIIDRNTILN